MALSERGVSFSKDVGEAVVTPANVIKEFGFDYRSVVENKLKDWGGLPDGHKLNFFDVVKIHKGSSGLYLMEEIVGNNWLFLQAMFKNGVSTEHMHGEKVVELYIPLAGKSLLNVDGKDYGLNPGMTFEVFPGQIHRLRTEEDSSLNLLVMKNSAHISRDKLHISVTKALATKLVL